MICSRCHMTDGTHEPGCGEAEIPDMTINLDRSDICGAKFWLTDLKGNTVEYNVDPPTDERFQEVVQEAYSALRELTDSERID